MSHADHKAKWEVHDERNKLVKEQEEIEREVMDYHDVYNEAHPMENGVPIDLQNEDGDPISCTLYVVEEQEERPQKRRKKDDAEVKVESQANRALVQQMLSDELRDTVITADKSAQLLEKLQNEMRSATVKDLAKKVGEWEDEFHPPKMNPARPAKLQLRINR